MRVLLDECVDSRLLRDLTGFDAKTVRQMGWTETTNVDKNAFQRFAHPAVSRQNIWLTSSGRTSWSPESRCFARPARSSALKRMRSRWRAKMLRSGRPTRAAVSRDGQCQPPPTAKTAFRSQCRHRAVARRGDGRGDLRCPAGGCRHPAKRVPPPGQVRREDGRRLGSAHQHDLPKPLVRSRPLQGHRASLILQ